ncbi:MAG: 5'/3'-nucleotidase SurE [Clostridia bacterium]|nr:5'/3'-nucleotidase SurE [Clostridia bacterium]
MRILIVNDDGIHAPGIRYLAEWAKKLGEVTVIAPKIEQSGKSHSIDIIDPFEIKQVDFFPEVTAYRVDSSPADCSRFGILGLKKAYDLVLSGINNGYNMGRDIVYSGTVGAVFEACGLGAKNAIAVSTCPSNLDHAIEHMDRVYDFIVKNDLFSHNSIYNVNIPPEAGEIYITRQGGAYYSDDFIHQGGDFYKQCGKMVFNDQNDLTLDTDTVLRGNISITPLTIERTNVDVFRTLASRLNP